MKVSVTAVRNTAGLLLGLGFGLIVTSPTVSALSMLPSLSLVAPGDGSNISGSVMLVAAADSEGLASLQFRLDGSDYGSAITSGSCRAPFDSTATADGPHSIQAVARDQFGNTVVSSPSTIFINNLAPAVSGVAVGNISSTSATVFWETATAADSQVEYGTSPAYGNVTGRDWTPVQSHAQTLTGLIANTTYHFRVYSVGQNSVVSSSGDFVFGTTNTPGNPPGPTPTPTPPGPTPTPPAPTPTPTPSPRPPTPTPTPSPTPTPTPPPVGGGSHSSATVLPNVRPSVPQFALTPEPGATISSGGQAQQPRVVATTAPGATTSSSGSSTGYSTKSSAPSATKTGQAQAPTKSQPRAIGAVVAKPKATAVPCSEKDPFAAEGGIGMCVDGYWLQLWKPAARGGRSK